MMTETQKHTPGPWYYVDNIESGEFFGCGVSESEGGTEFIWFDDARDPERDIAKARLIAAAPDLLEALERALTAMNYMGDQLNAMDAATADDVAAVTPAFNAARAAIKKARGND